MKRLFILFSMLPALLFAQSIIIDSGAEINIVGDLSGNTVLNCEGSLEIKGILDLDNDAILKIGGDFISSTSGNNIQVDNSTLVFNGSSAQEIKRGVLTNSSFSFYNLTIDNPTSVSIINTNITLISINNILDAKQGTFNTASVLRLRAVATSPFYARVTNSPGVISGNVQVEKRLSNTSASWRQISLPINATWATANFSGINLLYSGHPSSNQINAKYFNSGLKSGDYLYGWRSLESSFSTLVPANLWLDGSEPIHEVTQTFSCKGPLHSASSFMFNLDYNRDSSDLSGTNPDALGWNFIPNPWPALIDVNALLSSGTDFTPAYKAIHVYNSLTGNYQAILLNNTVTKIDYGSNGTTINDADANIPPFQGFWVKADATSQQVNLVKSTMQTTVRKNLLNETFMKTNPETIRFNVFDADSLNDQVVLYFNSNATRNFDYEGDAYFLKSLNAESPEFYAREGQSKASIVGRAKNTTDSVELNFKSSKLNQTFYVHADLDEKETGTFVYLRDRRTQQTTLLENGQSQKFTHVENISSPRFVVYFSKNEFAYQNLVDKTAANLDVFVRNNSIAIQSYGIEGLVQINVFDVVGRILFSKSELLEKGQDLSITPPQTGAIVFVETIYGNQRKVYKLFY